MTTEARGDGRPSVLVLEDDEDLAETFAAWLRTDHDVTVCHERAEAVERLDGSLDAALLDRRLPDGPGSSVLETIRERELDCRVAMVTAVEPDLDVVEMGFDEYLRKPVSKEELRAVVEQLLVQSELDGALRRTYRLARKKGLLETEYSRTELREREAYAELNRRIDELKREVDAKVGALSSRQVVSEMARE